MDGVEPWATRDMAGAYVELDHPADIFLEIRGPDLPRLFENSLYAFYDRVVELGSVNPHRELLLQVSALSAAEALRRLLTEALYHFETEGFVGAAAAVEGDSAEGSAEAARAANPQDLAVVQVKAHVFGEKADRALHNLLTEVKAVTYHQLDVSGRNGGGWTASVLLDV
jgi:SHS2 domain-containing protein